MKNKKRIIRICMAIALIILFAEIGSQTALAAKNTYWLTGGYENSSLTFTGKKFKFSGKWGKGSTLDKSAEKYYSNPSKYKKTIKKGKYKKGFIGSDGLQYEKDNSLEKNTNIVGITVHVKIKKNKVVAVVNSAM